MSGRVRLALFGVGVLLLAVLVRQVGPAELVANAASVGWVFVPVLALYGISLLCSAYAWRLTLAAEPARPPFTRLWSLTVSGTALNFVTPFINAGGEPFRIAGLAPWLGSRRATGSVILSRMLHTLALLLTWLTAAILALVLLQPDGVLLAGLWTAVVASGGLALLVFTGHQRGMLERILNASHRIPILARAGRRLEGWRETLTEMDRQIAEFYQRSPWRFVEALVFEYVARAMLMMEYYLVGVGLGIPLTPVNAYLVGGLASLAQNIVFLIPYEVGVKEGVLFLLFRLVGLDPNAGVYTALVIRARDVAWIGVGLLLIGVVPLAAPERSSPA